MRNYWVYDQRRWKIDAIHKESYETTPLCPSTSSYGETISQKTKLFLRKNFMREAKMKTLMM